jgi:RecJ-like exonuclease
MINDLVPFGLDANRIRQEVAYLVKAMCVWTEHQRVDEVADEDLVCLSPAGFAHLSLAANVDYLAACAEDTWSADAEMCRRVAEKIGMHGERHHYARQTTRANALDLVTYLMNEVKRAPDIAGEYLENLAFRVYDEFYGIAAKVERLISGEKRRESSDLDQRFRVGEEYEGVVNGVQFYGVFLTLEKGVAGLLHRSQLPANKQPFTFNVGQRVRVKVLTINRDERKMTLGLP